MSPAPGWQVRHPRAGAHPDGIDDQISAEIRKQLARSIKVNARPLTAAQWRELLEEAGLVVEWVGTEPMALLQMRRNIMDEGFGGTLRIVRNVIRDADARKHRRALTGIALVARKP